MGNQLGQCTLRLANIRPGLRRIVFRNERDNKENPMAIALVDVQMYTLAQMKEKEEMLKGRIEVTSPLSKKNRNDLTSELSMSHPWARKKRVS